MKIRRNLFLGTLLAFGMTQAASAASLTWDGNGTTTPNPDGGLGTWDANTTASWWNGSANVNWATLAGPDNDAIFGNNAGEVSIAAAGVSANDLTFNTTGYKLSGGQLTLVQNTGASVGATINTATNVSAEISSNIAGTFGATAATSLTKSGAGTLTLSGTNSFTGWVTITGGTLKVTKTAAINSIGTSNWIFANNGTFELDGTAGNIALTTRFQTNGGTILNTAGDNTISQGVYMNSTTSNTIKSEAGSLVISGTISGGSGSRKLTLAGASLGENRLAGIISNPSGAGTLTSLEKTGAGKWVLSNNNSYGGTTVITQGTLQIGDAGTTGTLSTLSTITNNGTLAFRRSNTITQGTNFASGISGISGISGTGGILVRSPSSAGVVILNGTNTFEGGITITSGVLKITSSAALGTGVKQVTLTGGGGEAANLAFQLDGTSGDITLSSDISFLASSNSGAGIRNIAGTNEIQGSIGLNTGLANSTIGSDDGTLTISGNISTTNTGRTLQLNGASTTANTVSGKITDGTGGIALSKTGLGTWILSSNDNNYTGPTTVSGGKLVIDGNISTSATTVKTTAILGGIGTVGGVLVEDGGKFAPGNSPGTMTFAGDLTLSLNSISDFEINAFTSGNYDLALAQVIGAQTVTFNSGILNLLFQSGFNTTGSVKIFDFDAYAGTGFSTVNVTGLATGYTATFNSANGIVTVIPETRAALLGGLGLLALLRRRRSA